MAQNPEGYHLGIQSIKVTWLYIFCNITKTFLLTYKTPLYTNTPEYTVASQH